MGRGGGREREREREREIGEARVEQTSGTTKKSACVKTFYDLTLSEPKSTDPAQKYDETTLSSLGRTRDDISHWDKYRVIRTEL